MLMSLGTLVTIAGTGAKNFVLMVVNNSTYEITGNQRLPGPRTLDFVGMAKAAGFLQAEAFQDADAFNTALPRILSEPGPTLIELTVEAEDEGPIGRSPEEPASYLQVSLATSARILRDALRTRPRAPV